MSHHSHSNSQPKPQPQPQPLTPWQVVEIVADESDADVTGELTIADKATVRWQEAD